MKIVWFGTAMLLVFGFQNCGKFATIEDLGKVYGGGEFSSMFADDCYNQRGIEGCIFYKNPMIQKSGDLTFAQAEGRELSSLMNFPIDTNERSHDRVANTGLQILSLPIDNGTGAEMSRESYRRQVVKIASWHWAGQVAEWFRKADGDNLLQSGLRIFPHSTQTGYSSVSGVILMKLSNDGLSDAFDSSVLIHLMGQAFVAKASGNALRTGLEVSHVDCGVVGESYFAMNCCKDQNGCARAISAGLSDYLVSVIFPNRPAVAELLGRDRQGMKVCGQYRSPSEMTGTAMTAYQACENQGQPGEIYMMGQFYSSLWFGVRGRVRAFGEEALSDFDKFYVKALGQVAGADNFVSYHEKLRVIDRAQFQGQFMSLFDTELSSRAGSGPAQLKLRAPANQ